MLFRFKVPLYETIYMYLGTITCLHSSLIRVRQNFLLVPISEQRVYCVEQITLFAVHLKDCGIIIATIDWS